MANLSDIWLGGPSTALGGSDIAPNNPFYSYFQNVMNQFPQSAPNGYIADYNKGNLNLANATFTNGQLNIPPQILDSLYDYTQNGRMSAIGSNGNGVAPGTPDYTNPQQFANAAINYGPSMQPSLNEAASYNADPNNFGGGKSFLGSLGYIFGHDLSVIGPALAAAATGGVASPFLGAAFSTGKTAYDASQTSPSNYNYAGNNPSLLNTLGNSALSGASTYAGNAIGNQFPETAASLNPFSASNVAPTDGINWNPDQAIGPNIPSGSATPFASGGMSLPGSISSPGTVGASPSSAPSFGPSSFTSSPSPLAASSPLSSGDPFSSISGSTSIPNPMGANISGASNSSPSIFDSLMKGDVSGAASGVGNYALNNPLTTLAGGATLAGGLSQAGVFNSPTNDATANSTFTPTPFNPTEQSQSSIPGSLSNLSGGDPFQQATNLATRGVYGGGNGPQETNYFLNLLNRQLFDQTGKLANDNSSINPIENSYLSQLGITGQNPTDILKGISQYGT